MTDSEEIYRSGPRVRLKYK